jgi:hypothetical protein
MNKSSPVALIIIYTNTDNIEQNLRRSEYQRGQLDDIGYLLNLRIVRNYKYYQCD